MILPGTNNTSTQIIAAIKKSKNPICCIDSRLDCDAVSSALVMSRILKKQFGVKLELTYVDNINENFKNLYQGIASLDSIRTEVDPSTINYSAFDLIILLDCGDPTHLSKSDNFHLPDNIASVNIDHHNDSNNLGCTFNYVHKAPSACSLLYEIFKRQGMPIDNISAKLLMLGLVDDSGVFQYDKIRPQDLRMAADILEQTKKDLFWFTYRITYHEAPDEIKLKRLTFANYHYDPDLKLAYSFATKNDYALFGIPDNYKTGNSPADFIRKTEGINFAFFIKEKEEIQGSPTYSVSLRSRLPDYDVSQIAAQYGGGGHIMSSGFRINDAKNMKDAINKVIKASQKYKYQE